MGLFALTTLLSGCRVERLYSRTQTEDGLAMKAPIEFDVRLRVDEDEQTVRWLEHSKGSDGSENIVATTYGGTNFSQCQVFDALNWSCTVLSLVPGQEPVIQSAMRDGTLTRLYFGGMETYRTRHRAVFRETTDRP